MLIFIYLFLRVVVKALPGAILRAARDDRPWSGAPALRP
jgi:hypothetical protein